LCDDGVRMMQPRCKHGARKVRPWCEEAIGKKMKVGRNFGGDMGCFLKKSINFASKSCSGSTNPMERTRLNAIELTQTARYEATDTYLWDYCGFAVHLDFAFCANERRTDIAGHKEL
jgi:hypothetical protein